jgi:hypothetical protein
MSTAALTPIQGWFGGESDAVAATAGVRSDLAAVEAAAEERRRLHDAFKRQWNEDDIIQVSCRTILELLGVVNTSVIGYPSEWQLHAAVDLLLHACTVSHRRLPADCIHSAAHYTSRHDCEL